MQFSYQTIKKSVENILLKEKGSRFIGFLCPVYNEADCKNTLESIRIEHPKATHHCYAFRMGLKGEHYRANDDGEPSGSAGLPIYNQLLAHDLTQVLLVVVRYYGGTKLGVSGLVKAYKECAKLALEQAEIITKELESEMKITFKFNQQNVIFSLLNKFYAKVLQFEADENCLILAKIKTSDQEKISELLSEIQYVSFELS
ncbi:MAG: YigZ family protein [Cloacibacterium sp.]|nr:YigZ family protein [Cloacibacterium sp.]